MNLSNFRQFEPVENFQYKTSRYIFHPFHYENLLEMTASGYQVYCSLIVNLNYVSMW